MFVRFLADAEVPKKAVAFFLDPGRRDTVNVPAFLFVGISSRGRGTAAAPGVSAGQSGAIVVNGCLGFAFFQEGFDERPVGPV